MMRYLLSDVEGVENYQDFYLCSFLGRTIIFFVYLFQKVIPRIFVCAIIPWILKEDGLIASLSSDETGFEKGLLTNDGAFVAFVILLFIVFIKFPPLTEKLYLIQKTTSAEEYGKIKGELDNLSRIYKELYRLEYGIYIFDNSYLIKCKCKIEINKLYDELSQEHIKGG